jgi:molybdopterin-guanine dinucleotide biosynthesis protein A
LTGAEPRRAAGVVVLAGGEASRLPGKLLLDAGGVPLLVRVLGNLSSGRETFVSCRGTFPARVDASIGAPLVVDRREGCGPLGGLVSTMARMASPFVFAVAGDAPLVPASLIDALEAQRRPGDEAVVPEHGEAGGLRVEPLAALYDRVALLREGTALLRAGRYSMHGLLARLRTRRVRVAGGRIFANVNTGAEYDRVAALRWEGAEG